VNIFLGIAALGVPGIAYAEAGGLGGDFLLAIGIYFYLVLCVVSLPISLLLRGSILKRIAFGLATPIVGMALGLMASQGLYSVRYIDFYEIDRVFVVVSAIPIVALLMWGVIGRVKARSQRPPVGEAR
jgi:hypothetical protein